MKHHTEDYKKSAVKYYVRQNENIRNTCQLKHYIKKESPNTYQDIVDCIKRILVTKIRITKQPYGRLLNYNIIRNANRYEKHVY